MEVEPAIYCAEQIRVPPQLAQVLKDYTKEVIRRQPEDLVKFSAYYFANLANIKPESQEYRPPTFDQISQLYRAVTSGDAVRTCDMESLHHEATSAGIDEGVLQQVMRIAQLGATSAVDPLEFCLLLITTVASDTTAMIVALTEVFGTSGAVEAVLCRDVFSVFGKYDTRWAGEFSADLDAQLGDCQVIGYNTLIELPCIKALLETHNP